MTARTWIRYGVHLEERECGARLRIHVKELPGVGVLLRHDYFFPFPCFDSVHAGLCSVDRTHAQSNPLVLPKGISDAEMNQWLAHPLD